MADTVPGWAGSKERGSARALCRRQENTQRWEAVFRRERRPVSLDRRAGDKCLPPHPRKGKLCVSPCHFEKEPFPMKQKGTVKKLALAGVLCAVVVAGSLLSFPVLGSKCAPVQHMVNVICAVFLGPWYGVAVAFVASLLRNLMAMGSLMAFPGSMIGALVCGVVFWKTKNLPATLAGEVLGTGVLGGLCAYPIATMFMGVDAAAVAFYAYIIPFLISTVAGSILAGLLVFALQKSGAINTMRATLES